MNIEAKAYINGKFINKKQKVEIVSPLNNQVMGTVPALKIKELNQAFESAHKSFDLWSKTKDIERIEYVKLFAQKLSENKKEFAEILYHEIGKPLNDGINEIVRSIEYINKTIKAYDEIKKTTVKVGNKTNSIYRVPLGVVLAISPFNYPINLSLSKIIPALVSGNTVVFKPATNGSIVGTMIGKLFDQIKLPKGVINVVTGKGSEIGDILTNHSLINMISFTGSVSIGKKIALNQHLIPIVLELGGNDGAYIRHDANLKSAAQKVAEGAFGFAGQRCTAIKRLIVHKKIKNQFISYLIQEIQKLPTTPLINQTSADWVLKLLNESKGKILIGGKRTDNNFSNTLIETTTKTKAWNEEAFGPLLPVVYIDNDVDALKILNDNNYGLQNSLFTKDIAWAETFALNLECGTVNINGASSRSPDEFPFLGIKDSGFGVQGIKEALLSMTRYLNVINNE